MDHCSKPASQVYLAHHGIKGQRWGVRRYQNPDGTLTEKGKARLEKKDNDWIDKRKFVAKRGEIGVMMALADAGYDMDQLKKGVWASGRVAYKKTVLDKV